MKKSILASAVLFACASVSYAASNIALEAVDKVYVESLDLTKPGNVYGIYVAGKEGEGINPVFESETIRVANVQRGIQVKSGNSKEVDYGSSSLTLGKSGITKNIDISATSVSHALGITVMGAGNDSNYSGPKVDISTETLKVSAKATTKEGWAYGLHVANNSTKATTEKATLNVKAKDIIVDAIGVTNSNAVGIVAMSQGVMNLDGNVYVNTQGGNGRAIVARGKSELNINLSGNNTVVLNGDISFDYDAPTSGTPVDANVNVVLKGDKSSWTGNTVVAWDWGSKEPSKDEAILSVKGLKLTLADGATWTPTLTSDDSTTQKEGSKYVALNKLKLDGGVVNVTGDDIDVTVENMTGAGTVNLATDGTTAGKFNVEAAEKASLSVNLMDTKLEKQLTADEINADQAKKLMANVGANADGENVVSTSTAVPEGMVNPAFGVDAEGKTHTASANTLMQSSLELASAAPLALNRIMMNDVRKRLGDIRTTEGTHGAWARYDGGKLSGEGGLENDFHTVQVGIDTVPTADSARMGVAFSYTDSDAEYARGSADMKAYSIAMYGTKVFDNGMFVDVIGRMGTADSDLTVDGQYKGTLDNVVLGVSGEFGWRFDVTNSMYIEPQAELSYAYVNGDKLTLGTAEYDVDSVNSLLGRVGFAAGLKCPSDMGNVYVRASAVHEFLGDSKITGANAGHTNVYEIDGKDTWVEYGLGANFNVTKSTYMWADVERTTGGALDEDWRATVGVRYAW